MLVFYTPTTQHLKLPGSDRGACTFTKFSDGELLVRIEQDVQDKSVWVVAATQAPAEHMLELFFLLDALIRSGAKIQLLFTYFGYARQTIADYGESCSAQVICKSIQQFPIQQTLILHPHTLQLQNFLPFTPIYAQEFFCKHAKDYDAVAAPDEGVADFAREIAEMTNKECITLNKVRSGENVEIINVDGPPVNKRVLLIDDMISTGSTLVKAADALLERGALSVSAASTHGVFAPDGHQLLEKSRIEKIFVTNSIQQKPANKLVVEDISSLLSKQMELYT